MPVVTNDVESYHGDQFVVEQRHAGLVQEQLRRLGLASNQLDSNDALRLTLMALSDITAGSATLRHDSTLMESAVRDRRSRGQSGDAVTDLDLVLFAVRRLMRETYDGWVATIGKNRVLSQVDAAPYIKGSYEPPRPAPAVSIPAATRHAGARVGILDTRVLAHPALAGRVLGSPVPDFGPAPRSTQGHATFIAGLIAQQAPLAELVVRAVLDDDGINASSWDVATKMVGVLDADVAVLNLSLCCATVDRVPPLCLTRAVERLIGDVVIVAAAGNHGSGGANSDLTAITPQYPAAIDGVVGVGAYDRRQGARRPAAFSPVVPWVEVLAPGVDEASTFLPGTVRLIERDADGTLVDTGKATFADPGYAYWSGTSFAAANVSGAIASLIVPGEVDAYAALDRLRNSTGDGADIVPYAG
jgi:subtilisin family serine protease